MIKYFNFSVLPAIMLCAALAMVFAFYMPEVLAAPYNEWKISTANTWTLKNSHYYDVGKDSPSRYMSLNETITHRELKFRVPRNIVDDYTFSVGCVLQSKVPSFILRTSSLDVPIQDSKNGYVFARFIVDRRQEMAMRGEIMSAGRLVFMPYTKAQEQKLSDLFLQLNEGGRLRIALLRGRDFEPLIYNIPLAGFKELSQTIVDDCQRLNQGVGEVQYLPDYVTFEPRRQAPKGFKLKRGGEGGGATPTPGAEDDEDEDDEENGENGDKQEEPVVHDFKPDGSVSSIGPDGMPITNGAANGAAQPAANGANGSGGTNGANGANGANGTNGSGAAPAAGPMQIDAQGNPVF